MAGEHWILLPTGDTTLVLAYEAGAIALLEGEPEAVVDFFQPLPDGVRLASIVILRPPDAEEPRELLAALIAAAPAGSFSLSVARVVEPAEVIAAALRARFTRTPQTFH